MPESSPLMDLANCVLSEHQHELCEICGIYSEGYPLCKICTPAALRVLARAVLESGDYHWKNAEQEWGETKIALTSAPTRRNIHTQHRTKAASPALLDILRRSSKVRK
jgi:hypothetical protein